MYSAGGTEDTQSEREGQRERLVANQTHLKTAPSGPRHELSAMVKFMRRMQQQYVQQQRQQQQQLAVQQNQSAANSTLSLHHMEYKKEKDEQGRLRRRFLQDFFMEYGLENNFMGNANATQTGKASSFSYSHRHCLRAQRMPNVWISKLCKMLFPTPDAEFASLYIPQGIIHCERCLT